MFCSVHSLSSSRNEMLLNLKDLEHHPEYREWIISCYIKDRHSKLLKEFGSSLSFILPLYLKILSKKVTQLKLPSFSPAAQPNSCSVQPISNFQGAM